VTNSVFRFAMVCGALSISSACGRDAGQGSSAHADLQQTLAGPQLWMKSERPNELGLTVFIDEDCPGDASPYERAVRRTFSRNQIRRVPVVLDEMHLNVTVDCLRGDMMHVFSAEAEFVRRSGAGGDVTSLGPGYVESGLGSLSEILDGSERVTEQAISDYLTANFDL